MSTDTIHSSWQTAALTISICKWGITRCLFSMDRSITGRKFPVFFGTRNSLLKKIREQLLWTDSMAPFSSRLSTAFCRSCFLLLVRKWMGVLVKGGWWHSLFNRTPDHRILDDMHSPSRFCHCWVKTARRAPTNTPSLSGLLWCIRWRSCCFVTCSAVRSKRTGYNPSWPTGGPSLWCTHGLNCVDDFGAGFSGTLKWLVRPLCRACWSFIVKIFSSNSWAVLALAICSSCSCSCPKATSLQINWRLDTTAVAEAMAFCIMLTCSRTTLSLASSRMYFKTDTTNESVMDP